jgi:hypothetical protein
MAAKLKILTLVVPSFAGEASLLPHGMLAKQDIPPSHSALVPLGQGLAVSPCVTTQEKSDSGVNIELNKKLTFLENYECLGSVDYGVGLLGFRLSTSWHLLGALMCHLVTSEQMSLFGQRGGTQCH